MNQQVLLMMAVIKIAAMVRIDMVIVARDPTNAYKYYNLFIFKIIYGFSINLI